MQSEMSPVLRKVQQFEERVRKVGCVFIAEVRATDEFVYCDKDGLPCRRVPITASEFSSSSNSRSVLRRASRSASVAFNNKKLFFYYTK